MLRLGGGVVCPDPALSLGPPPSQRPREEEVRGPERRLELLQPKPGCRANPRVSHRPCGGGEGFRG